MDWRIASIIVSDDGPGMPPEMVKKIFSERFTTKSVDRGTGLGLSIVKRLSIAANAAVHLKTVPGEGTTFTVSIPVASEGQKA